MALPVVLFFFFFVAVLRVNGLGHGLEVDPIHLDHSATRGKQSRQDAPVPSFHTANSKLQLFHRDELLSSGPFTVEARIKRDVKRIANFFRQLTNDSTVVAAKSLNFGSGVVSGIDVGSGEYFVRIGVGSPPRYGYMVIDTGSDNTWIQCQPCEECYSQTDPIFDPSTSITFTDVSCTSAICNLLEKAHTGCYADRCSYKVTYNDGSYSQGTFALETLTFGSTVVRDIAIGCGHRNHGNFIAATGVLGIGGGSMSLVGQLGGQIGGAFTYCLVSRGTAGSGFLVFGREEFTPGAKWVPLVRNIRAPSLYYVGLLGLGVGGNQVPIPESVFHLDEFGKGGVIIDTGTAVTRFRREAYIPFRDAFTVQTASLPRASSPVSLLDTCYDLSGFDTVQIPTVSFYFSGFVLTIPGRNILIPMDKPGIQCFAFASSDPYELSIIGNIQQEGIQISIDSSNGFVGFGPKLC